MLLRNINFHELLLYRKKNPPVEQNGLMMKHKLDLIFRDKNMQSLKLTTNTSQNISKILRVTIYDFLF